MPPWAHETLTVHGSDERPAVYTAAELKVGETDAALRRKGDLDAWVDQAAIGSGSPSSAPP
ncbi:MAG: hypothetical protein ACRBI6_11170 [Acidimicrobiales bacterium]